MIENSNNEVKTINNMVEKPQERIEEYHAQLTPEEEQAIQYEKMAKRLDDIQNDCFRNPFLTSTQKVAFSQKIRPVIGHCTGKVRYLRGEITPEEIKRNKEEMAKRRDERNANKRN